MSSSEQQWCTIESDPGVFTSLIESLGVKNAEFAELWSLDDDSLSSLGGTVFGLIFLFKWTRDSYENNDSSSSSSSLSCLSTDETPSDLFFARQVTTNACATQAILSVLLNNSGGDQGGEEGVSLGPVLESFKTFTSSFPPELRGEAIGASEDIRIAHNSFARNDSFLADKKQRTADEDDDVFHFVAYIPHNDGCVYELDGLREGPIRVGRYDNTTTTPRDDNNNKWLPVARKAIQDRIEKYAASEIKFNLMAVIRDKRIGLNEKLKLLEEAKVGEEDILDVRTQMEQEEEKRRQWTLENERRRHNYLPFIVQLVKEVVRSGNLEDMTEKANERVKDLKRKAEERKEKGFLPGQEAGNVNIVLDGGFGDFCDEPWGISEEVACWLQDEPLLDIMSRAARSVGKPNAAMEIVQDIGDITHRWMEENKNNAAESSSSTTTASDDGRQC